MKHCFIVVLQILLLAAINMTVAMFLNWCFKKKGKNKHEAG